MYYLPTSFWRTQTREYIKDKEGNYCLKVSGEVVYNEVKKTKCFDAEGNCLGFHEKTYQDVKEETKVYEFSDPFLTYNVVQIDYEFYLLPTGYVNTLNEVYKLSDEINRIFKVKTKVKTIDDIMRKLSYWCDGNGNVKDLFIDFNKPIEFCCRGATRSILKASFTTFKNLDLSDYKERLDIFKRKYPEYSGDAESIYKTNIQIISAFYMVKPDDLLKKHKHRNKLIINRLHFNINNNYPYTFFYDATH